MSRIKTSKILIVDDSPESRKLSSDILQRQGYEIFQASNGKDCLRIAWQENPDLILLDLLLPDVSGIDLCRQIKSDSKLERTLVINMFDVESSTDSQADGLEAGGDGYLTKPIQNRTLLAYVKALLRIRKTQEGESEERCRLVENLGDYAIFMLDTKGNIVTWNKGAERILGYEESEVVGQPCSLIFTPEDVQSGAVEEEIKKATTEGRADNDRWLVRKNGARFWASGVLSKLQYGNLRSFLKVLRDNTENKLGEEQIKTSLKEKEVMLREIHHRVRNNLQIISSLLNLQSDFVKDEHAREIFKESQNRIRSIALVHEQLYRSKNLSRIQFAEYTRNLIAYLFRLYNASPSVIKPKLDIDDEFLSLNEAIPCGLILNELVSNSLRHAFPSGQEGEICVRFTAKASGKLELVVSDNGVGFPDDLDLQNTNSLGMRLVRTLAEQLSGEVEVSRGGGAGVRIIFTRQN